MAAGKKIITFILSLSLAGSALFAQTTANTTRVDHTIIHLESGEALAYMKAASQAETRANTYEAYVNYQKLSPSDSEYAAFALNKLELIEEVYESFDESNPEYLDLLWTARAYESKKNYVYALAFYYDAILAEPAYSNEAFLSYNRIADEIRNGNPGTPIKDAKAMASEWTQIQKNLRKYWNEYCPLTVHIGRPVAVENGKSRPDCEVKVTFEETDKYLEIMGLLEKGCQKATGKSLEYQIPSYNVRFSVRRMKDKSRLLPSMKYIYGDEGVTYRKPSKSSMKRIAENDYYISPVAVYLVDENGKETELDLAKVDITTPGKPGNQRFILNDYKRNMAVLNIALKMNSVPNRTFSISKTEVTCAEYSLIMDEKSHESDLSNLPKTEITWYDAILFCNKLSEEAGLVPCYDINGEKVIWNKNANGYRLPTSTEWEVAAKGGINNKYAGGNILEEVAWFDNNSGNQLHEVGLKLPNQYGLYDMSGNASEWCWNSFADGDVNRMRRGGSYANPSFFCEIGDQDYSLPGTKYKDLGFRLCRNVSDDDKIMIEAGNARVIAETARKAHKLLKQELNNLGLKKEVYIKMPDHRFYLNPEEVTQDLYELVMDSNPSEFLGSDRPVENVSWYNALAFCNRLSEIKGYTPAYIISGKEIIWNKKANGYRLPTVEEWEYAAKGGIEFAYSGSSYLDLVGWYNKNSDGVTHEVAQKEPNDYGMYDMSGNVWEWCWDPFKDGKDVRVVRGGSYNYSAACCEVGYNNFDFPSESSSYVGFRLCRGPITTAE